MLQLTEQVSAVVDGRRCLQHVRELGAYDRSLGSSGYHAAAAYVESALQRRGLTTHMLTWAMDDSPVPWNWNLPRAWEPHAARFQVVSPEQRTLVNFFDTPTCIHPWSAPTPADGVTAEIVHVGPGISDDDYAGKDVAGKIVFADRGANWLAYVHAIERRGALGYISDDILAIPGTKTREQFPDMVLWYTFYEREIGTGEPIKGWGLSISPRMGDYLRDLLTRGRVTGHCLVDVKTFDGVMENVVGSIEGTDLADEEFLCMAHLDHYRPGAMDNASGCAVLLEAGDALATLVSDGRLPAPRRSLRFAFGAEGHISNIYPHSLGPNIDRIIGSWTVDMAGGKPHVVGGPMVFHRASAATPTFLSDLGPAILKESCLWFTGMNDEPVASPAAESTVVHTRPGASPFKFETIPYGIHSDNSCIAGWTVPAVGIGQWPATNWHNQYDTIDKLDAQELARCAWATAIASYRVATAGPSESLTWMYDVAAGSRRRLASVAHRLRQQVLVQAGGQSLESVLERGIDELRYCAERDQQAVASCLSLVRQESDAVRTQLDDHAGRLSEELAGSASREIDDLRAFALGLSLVGRAR